MTLEEPVAILPTGVPARLGRYELRAKIADGGMAEVFVARRVEGPGAGEIVALKTIREQFARNREFVTMFTDEARIVARLRHPNIIRYDELGTDDDHLFLVMELLIGQSLWSLWEACRARGVRLRYDMVAWIGARVADGLHYAHDLADERGVPLGIVHRDVNASNVFVTYDGEVKVIDFGLAKATNRASKTAAGIIKGKVAYMSPEQSVGADVDRRSDVFALGTTLWEIGCDRRLFKRDHDVDTLRRVHAADVPDPTRLVDGFPPELWRVLRRALARDRDQRYATAAEFAHDLDALFPGTTSAQGVATVMRELFAGDQPRQLAWVADVSGPTPSRAATEPLKAPSTFWTGDREGGRAGLADAPRPNTPAARVPGPPAARVPGPPAARVPGPPFPLRSAVPNGRAMVVVAVSIAVALLAVLGLVLFATR